MTGGHWGGDKGGGRRGDKNLFPHSRAFPPDVMREASTEGDQVTKNLPQGLLDTLDYLDPGRNRCGYERHSDESYTLYLYNSDGELTFWRACLSLDGRWTLSPIY